MSRNPTFVQALADASGKPVEVSAEVDSTTLGAGFLAGVATGVWADLRAAASAWRCEAVVEPRTEPDRDRWEAAVERAAAWIPELSALDF
jgi:glycerol kinase